MRVGVWIVGALGDVATTTVVGAQAVAAGLAESTGLVTAQAPFAELELAPLDALVFGGHDVRAGSPQAAAVALRDAGVLPARLLAAGQSGLEAYAARIRPGVSFGASQLVRSLEGPEARSRRQAGPQAALAAIRADLRAFRSEESLDRVVMVALASTEPRPAEPLPELGSAERVLQGVERDDPRLPASCLYALAAFLEGCAYVNFTPSLGSAPAGLQELARRQGVPHMGQDGKTGQTLLRTVLAPMFLARNLRVLSWSGFNILGNRDGQVLDEPAANAAKTRGKDRVLGSILGDSLGSSLTKIDYVPSLGDWKSAWDYIHFEGFLGTKMALQLTWQGCDSALAAPLVLDLVRLIELAARRGRSGLQPALACFFKTPLGCEEQSFPAQMQLLHAYAHELRAPAAPRAGRAPAEKP